MSRAYYGDLAMGLQSTYVYGDTALCLLPRAEGAEIVGEMADLLVRCRELKRVLSGAIVDGNLLISVRTKGPDDATQLVQAVLEGRGSGGGHEHRAGGKIPNVGANGLINRPLKQELRARWLKVCGIPQLRGKALIQRREIMENL